MERDDSVLLHEPDLMLAVLRVAAARVGTVDACIDHLRALRARAQVEQRLPEADVRVRLQAITAKLDRASLIERRPAAPQFRITARGRRVLAEHPPDVDDRVLMQPGAPRVAATGQETPLRDPARVCSEYDAGYRAHGEGQGLADNPHPADARAHLDWQNGWSQAHDDDLRRSGRD